MASVKSIKTAAGRVRVVPAAWQLRYQVADSGGGHVWIQREVIGIQHARCVREAVTPPAGAAVFSSFELTRNGKRIRF